MTSKRKKYIISFILYPSISTLMAGLISLEWSDPQVIFAPLIAVIMAGVSLFPILLLIEHLSEPKKLIWREAQAFGILLTGGVAIGCIMALGYQKGFGVMSWELILYSKPVGAYIICSLCYLIRAE